MQKGLLEAFTAKFALMKFPIWFISSLCLVLPTTVLCGAMLKEPALFSDACLDAAIKAEINFQNRTVKKHRLAAITKLNASKRGISNLDNLKLLTNLTQLDLGNNEIRDLRPLNGLLRLQKLILVGNQIESIEPLRHLRNLKHLDLSYNQIKDISPLHNLEKLEVLNLRHNRIENGSTFCRFKKVPNKLYIHGNPFRGGLPSGHYLKEIRATGIDPTLGVEKSKYRLLINEVMASTGRTKIAGCYSDSDWIEIYNAGDTAINLNRFSLADKIDPVSPWFFPDVSIAPAEYMLVWASGRPEANHGFGLHANFRINRDGESIILSDPRGKIVDAVRMPPAFRNISFGRRYKEKDSWIFFEHPTPGKPNICLDFSHDTGFYTAKFMLELTTPHENTQIRYSLDGSTPTSKSEIYFSPIKIGIPAPSGILFSNISSTSLDWAPPKAGIFRGTVVRARLFRNGNPLGPVVTKTYFVDSGIHHRYSFPIVSLVADPKDLFNFENGIYVMGKKFVEFRKTNPIYTLGVIKRRVRGNYSEKGKAWERPVHIDYFEANGLLGFSQNAGIRIFGGTYNRKLAQKPFILYARKQYDARDEFTYDVFPGLIKSRDNKTPLRDFKHLLLRTSGQDARHTLMADAMMQSLVSGILDIQAYHPVIVFLNGEYWGIYNIREHMDEHYIQSHYNLPSEQVVLMENFAQVKSGSKKTRREIKHLLRFLNENSLAVQRHYDHIKEIIDIENFMDYCIAQIYFNNKDWPGNNNRYWKKKTTELVPGAPHSHDGRWRWLLYDTDYGFGASGGLKAHRYNTLKMATEVGGRHWPNPDKSTRLLRCLLQNNEFKTAFINRFADYLNTIFKEEVVLERISRMAAVLSSEIPEHIDRWGASTHNITSMASWKKCIGRLVSFARKRPRHIRQHIIDYFELESTSRITLNVHPFGSGMIKINTVEIRDCSPAWKGVYFNNIPIEIRAVSNKGYEFKQWIGSRELDSQEATIDLTNDTHLTALFQK